MSFLVGEAFDYNNYVKQIRGYMQGHPQVFKTNPFDSQDGITITGTGDGTVYVATEAFTPAGSVGSPAGSPSPGTLYRLTCTVAGNASTSPIAAFDVEQDPDNLSPAFLGSMLVGQRFLADDLLASPQVPSPLHGLEVIIETLSDWVVADTIEFRLVDHTISPTGDVDENWVEDRYTEGVPDVNDDFVTEWIAHAPTIAGAGASPQTPMHFGMQTTFDFGDQFFNVALLGADDFESSSLFAAQPNASPLTFVFLDDQSFPFWLTGDADAMCAVARPGSVYEWAYLGIIDVFATGNQHPKPMFVGGMGEDGTRTFSEVNNSFHAAFWNGGSNSPAYFRWVDGTWFTIINRNNSTYTTRNNFPARWLSPWRSYDTGAPLNTSQPDTMQDLTVTIVDRYDGTFECLPATMFFHETPQPATVGDLKFVKFVPGFTINSEDEGRDNTVSPRLIFLAFQNAQLGAREDFAAMELI